mmetsp:Transcript_29938/g.53884  ORF Transcript_29938/g.53884 Transcript_29938/m.53884 type:complete len:226 (-) Transcript_29938:830-1507(-)
MPPFGEGHQITGGYPLDRAVDVRQRSLPLDDVEDFAGLPRLGLPAAGGAAPGADAGGADVVGVQVEAVGGPRVGIGADPQGGHLIEGPGADDQRADRVGVPAGDIVVGVHTPHFADGLHYVPLADPALREHDPVPGEPDVHLPVHVRQGSLPLNDVEPLRRVAGWAGAGEPATGAGPRPGFDDGVGVGILGLLRGLTPVDHFAGPRGGDLVPFQFTGRGVGQRRA